MNESTTTTSDLSEAIRPSSKPHEWFERGRFLNAPPGQFPFGLSLLSWGLNEEENIVGFLKRAQTFMSSLNVDFEHIFIDDGSTDRTYALACAFQRDYPQLRIIRNPTNFGSGWNTRIAVANATKEFLFWQTADWAYDIESFRTKLSLLKDFDVLQGVRTTLEKPPETLWQVVRSIDFDKRSDNRWKAVISTTNYILVRLLFRLPVLDFQNVTVYPTRLAQSLQLESHSAFTNPELLLKAYWKQARIKQVRVAFIARTKGKAKGTRIKTILRSIQEILFYWVKWVLLGQREDKLKGTVAAP